LVFDITATVLKSLKVGDDAPAFTVATLNSKKKLSLVELRGKVVVLDFWAFWCEPCVKELPYLKKVYDKYQEEAFLLLGISLDSGEKPVLEFIKKHQIAWPQVFDGEGFQSRLAKAYGVRNIPNIFLIDAHGKVRGMELQGVAIEHAVAQAIQAAKRPEVAR